MKAVIYARFSSDKQNEASIEGQLRECMDYAERTGITVIGNYIDRALSARTDNRPEFRRMIKDSAKGCFDIVLVWLKAQMTDVLKKIENIIQAIEQEIIFESTRDRFAALEKEKKELEMSILEEQIERPLLTREQIRFGIERFGKLNIENEEDKKRLIDNFINAIYLYDNKITFTFNYKNGAKTVLLSECDFTSVGSDFNGLVPPIQHTSLTLIFKA